MVCSTALMIVGSHISKDIHPGSFLICYPAGQTPRKRKVFALNQFGRAAVAIHKTDVLCLPSRRR